MIKYEVISNFANKQPSKLALIDESEKISWAEYKELVAKAILEVLKVNQFNDEPVLFISKNSAKMMVLWSALSTMNIAAQGLDYYLSKESLIKLINQLGAKVIFISREYISEFSYLNDICKLYQIETIFESMESIELGNNFSCHFPQKAFKSYAFTSGTTGVPKIVYRTSSFDKRRFGFLEEKYNFNNDDVHLACLPMFHVGTTGWLRLFLNLGATVVIHNFKNGYSLCDVVHKYEITTTLMSPYMLKQMISGLDEEDRNYFPQLKFIITGGKNCQIRIKQEAIRKLGPVINEYYGTTETGINTLLSSNEAIKYPGSVGKVFEGNKVLVLDESNHPVKAGMIGRIAISSYMNMECYLNSESRFIEIKGEKYLRTADYGYFNEDGYLFVSQRSGEVKKDVFDFYAIENEVMSLDFVSDVFVNDALGEENVKINIVPKKYFPYNKIEENIHRISSKYGVSNSMVNVVDKIDYTHAGKVKLTSAIV